MRLGVSDGELRPWRPGDEDALARHADDRRVWLNMRDAFPHPYTRRDAEAWVAHASAQSPATAFAIVMDGEPVGGIGLMRQADVHRHTAELGYWIGAAYWGRGLATAAVRAVTAYAFDELGLLRVYAMPFAPNRASARVLEKAGYLLEATLRRHVLKDGRLLDELVYAALRDEWETGPASST
jgi:RimJ/RimL family protein N-acetyltransferase